MISFHEEGTFRDDNARKNVIRKELLGTGSFGSVYRGDWLKVTKEEDKDVAIKIISYSGEQIEKLGRELYFLKRFNSPFTVKYCDSFLYNKYELWIVMELGDAGSFQDLYKLTRIPLSEAELQATIACCLLGLEHIHGQRSIHRDIKAGNILLSSSGKAMLSDFGISTKLTDSESRRKTVVGTPYWMAPEILLEAEYGMNVDIWSLGVTIIELCEGKPPHSEVKPISAMFLISYKPAPSLAIPDNWSKHMQSFLSRCLIKDADARASIGELLTHEWIRNEVKTLRSCVASGQSCSLPALVELCRRHHDAILAKRQKVDEFDLGFEQVDDGTETWEADRPTMTSYGPRSSHERRTWHTMHFNESNFKSQAMGFNNSTGFHRVSLEEPQADHTNDTPIPPPALGKVAANMKASDSGKSQHTELGSKDTFVRNPNRKFPPAADNGADFYDSDGEDTVVIENVTALRARLNSMEIGDVSGDFNAHMEDMESRKSDIDTLSDVRTLSTDGEGDSQRTASVGHLDEALEPIEPSLKPATGKAMADVRRPAAPSLEALETSKARLHPSKKSGRDNDKEGSELRPDRSGKRSGELFVVPEQFREVVDRLTMIYPDQSPEKPAGTSSSAGSPETPKPKPMSLHKRMAKKVSDQLQRLSGRVTGNKSSTKSKS